MELNLHLGGLNHHQDDKCHHFKMFIQPCNPDAKTLLLRSKSKTSEKPIPFRHLKLVVYILQRWNRFNNLTKKTMWRVESDPPIDVGIFTFEFVGKYSSTMEHLGSTSMFMHCIPIKKQLFYVVKIFS